LESKVVDGIAVPQPFGRSRQAGFGQFSSRLHRDRALLRMN
jgi:hypothetical protein